MPEPAHQQTQQRSLLLFGGEPRYRKEVSSAVQFEYATRHFGDAREALDAALQETPDVILVDEDTDGSSDARFLNAIQASSRLRTVPVVYTAGTEEKRRLKSVFSGIELLEKPYKRSALFRVLTKQVSRSVEDTWENIEPIQRNALKESLDAFNAVADAIASGEPVSYAAVADKCQFLNTAIRDNKVNDLLSGVRNYDNYSYVHSLRIATFLGLLGKHMGIDGDDLSILTCGGLLHDIGKLTIPHDVLNKPGRLTAEEFEVMKSHVTATRQMLSQDSDLPRGIHIIACQHHEKLDGTGYPDGLKGGELNELARMASIVDVFGALTDRRIYKPAMPPEDALELMGTMKGHLDLDMLPHLREMLLDSFDQA